jgi:hypothetical protein
MLDPRLQPIMLRLVGTWAEEERGSFTRLERALELVEGCSYIGEDTWVVKGSRGDTYYVRVDLRAHTSTCTCLDLEHHGAKCKHRWAIALLWKATQILRWRTARRMSR